MVITTETLPSPDLHGKVGKSGMVNIQDVALSGGRDIIDIRRDREEISLVEEIRRGLRPADGGEKRLPTLLLYDEAGLKLFEDITYLDEYYLTNTEIRLLEREANAIAQHIAPGSIIVELGSGNLRKVDIFLKAIDRLGKDVEYYALDLSLRELQRTLAAIPKGSYNHVQCFGLHGTYDDGLAWLQKPLMSRKKKTILSIGSSMGNFSRSGAATFLKAFAEGLNPTDTFLIALDGCKDADRVYHAYNDLQGVTHEFIRNGLRHANQIIGSNAFDLDVWRVIGEFNEAEGRHQAFVSPSQDTYVEEVLVKKDERVRIEESHKYSEEETNTLWQAAGLTEKMRWTNKEGVAYSIHMLSKTKFAFDWAPEQYAPGPIPTWDDWNQLWRLWDAVTRDMTPDEELLEKPIKLRNACIFYLGHIPTFFDIKLGDVTDGKPTEPAYYRKIFERGIDPDVDDPEKCHDHSEVPDSWPPVDEILAFQANVRRRVRDLYDTGAAHDPKVARALWLGYEHEAMHLETLLYMLIQSDKTRPPPGTLRPSFDVLAEQARQATVPNAWFKVPESHLVVGIEDPESVSGPSRFFGWDIEKPSRKAHVASFEAKARPITVGEYASYLEQTQKTTIPASWDVSSVKGPVNGSVNGHLGGRANGVATHDTPSLDFIRNKTVRTVYGAVPLEYCLDWPVSASYDELAGCAAWMGGRIPTLEETRSIYNYVDLQKKEAAGTTQKTIPAVNGHLINNGVQESPPSQISHANGDGAARPDPNAFFVDLHGANVGFQLWHPAPVTAHGDRLSGQGEFGGLWEWTSTALQKHEGYESMPLYPAYSADFFDDKHNVVLGGSWATVPRIAGRKSFVNWYQRNYPYVWAGARVVRDL